MQINLTNIGRFIISLVIIVLFGAICFQMVLRGGYESVLNTMFGFLGGAFSATVSFWLGTTQSSDNKSETIAHLANKAMEKTPPADPVTSTHG